MRVLDQVDPRWVTMLLVPVLLAAGAVNAEPEAAPRSAPAVVDDSLGPRAQPVAERGAFAPPVQPSDPAAPRTMTRRGSRSGPASGSSASIEQRGQAALRSLDYDWQALGYDVVFRPYDGRGLGSANRVTRTITVYVRPRQSELTLRTSLAHELGHALDFEHGTRERRDRYRRIRGLPQGSPWFPCDRCDDLDSPAGDFAEVFAAWLVGPGDFRGRLEGPPDARQLRELTPLLRLPRRSAAATPGPTPTASPSARPDREPTGPLPALLGGEPDPSPTPTTLGGRRFTAGGRGNP